MAKLKFKMLSDSEKIEYVKLVNQLRDLTVKSIDHEDRKFAVHSPIGKMFHILMEMGYDSVASKVRDQLEAFYSRAMKRHGCAKVDRGSFP